MVKQLEIVKNAKGAGSLGPKARLLGLKYKKPVIKSNRKNKKVLKSKPKKVVKSISKPIILYSIPISTTAEQTEPLTPESSAEESIPLSKHRKYEQFSELVFDMPAMPAIPYENK